MKLRELLKLLVEDMQGANLDTEVYIQCDDGDHPVGSAYVYDHTLDGPRIILS